MTSLDDVFGEFPDRPNTRDFWRLSLVVLQLDGGATEDEFGRFALPDFVDEDSLVYLARQRIATVARLLGTSPTQAETALMLAVYVEAFLVGCKFSERGGHRDG